VHRRHLPPKLRVLRSTQARTHTRTHTRTATQMASRGGARETKDIPQVPTRLAPAPILELGRHLFMFYQTKSHKHVASAACDRESTMAQLAAMNHSHALRRAVDAATFLEVCASPRKLGWVIEKQRKGHERAISMHRQLTLPALSILILNKKHVNGRHGLRAKAETRSNRPLHPRR